MKILNSMLWFGAGIGGTLLYEKYSKCIKKRLQEDVKEMYKKI